MNGIVHPFSGALYEQHDGGTVKVSLDETWGIFATNGRHLEGPLRECDPQMCGWVGGPLVSHYRLTSTNDEPTHS